MRVPGLACTSTVRTSIISSMASRMRVINTISRSFPIESISANPGVRCKHYNPRGASDDRLIIGKVICAGKLWSWILMDIIDAEELMLKKKITFIGPGVMAEAMIAGLLRKKLAQPEKIIVSGPREERSEQLHKKYGIKTSTDNTSAASQADVVVLSV